MIKCSFLLVIPLLSCTLIAENDNYNSLQTVYITDLGKAVPQKFLSPNACPKHWQTIHYTTDKFKGIMVGAYSFIDAPPITIPVNLKGWYKIYVGYWKPPLLCDGSPCLKIKLTKDSIFRRIYDDNSIPETDKSTYIREVFVKKADMTNNQIVLAKQNGTLGSYAYYAYIKFVPLSQKELHQLEIEAVYTKNLTAVIDGMSYFWQGECTEPEHVLEIVERYKDSDIERVLWAVNYGEFTNYPTNVDGLTFTSSPCTKGALIESNRRTNHYVSSEKQMFDSLNTFAEQKTLPQTIVSNYIHSIGLKFDIMIRLGILSKLPVHGGQEHCFLAKHPEFRQQKQDGTMINKASYAYPEVRKMMLNLIVEAANKFDIDGVNLCFVRGPHFIAFEEPVRKLFRNKYGLEISQVPENDPRLGEIRSEFMTEFIKDVRMELGQISTSKNKKIELSIWIWPWGKKVWLGNTPQLEGLDVESWVKNNLIDTVICQDGFSPEYMEWCNANNVRFVYFSGYHGTRKMSPANITEAYNKGIKHFAYWDIDYPQNVPGIWEWLRQTGNYRAMKEWDPKQKHVKLEKLITVGNINVDKGLADCVYSGG